MDQKEPEKPKKTPEKSKGVQKMFSNKFKRGSYLTGNSWRCAKSPTSAHHWKIRGKAICVYCLMEKEIDVRGMLIDAEDSQLLVG